VPTPADDLIALVRDVWLHQRQKQQQRIELSKMTDSERLAWWQRRDDPHSPDFSQRLQLLMVPARAGNYAALAAQLRDVVAPE
jgi:hypothetical protein